MIANKEIAAQFKILAKVMEIHNENPFKIRSYQNAARTIEQMQEPLEAMPRDAIGNIKGIGQAIHKKILDILDMGTLPLLEQYMDRTPEGVVEMLQLKGLGGKKIGVLWRELGVTTLDELLDACRNDQVAELKGFGEKMQQNIVKAIEYLRSNVNKALYARAHPFAMELLQKLKKVKGAIKADLTGEIRRKEITIEKLEYVVATEDGSSKPLQNLEALEWTRLEDNFGRGTFSVGNDWTVEVHFCEAKNFTAKLFETTTPSGLIASLNIDLSDGWNDEEEIFQAAGFPYIVPEMREEKLEVDYLKSYDREKLITRESIKGLIHAHSTYSDGQERLEAMAKRCMEKGYEYLVISDHSQSAFYANGLSPERIKQQHQDIEQLNEELAPFKIYKGIESDILPDGSLDYEEKILDSFDVVIASVHSQLKMDQEKATQRLLKAIENPHTTILGHMTARLLTKREGYPVDHKKIIDACAANHVSIELNANPFRLDMDWQYIPYAQEKGVMISINPDAHSLNGIEDVKYGVNAARKGGLLKQNTLNILSTAEFEMWITSK